jgi:hypothetical protein
MALATPERVFGSSAAAIDEDSWSVQAFKARSKYIAHDIIF